MFFTRPDDTTARKKFKSTLSGRCADLIFFPRAVGVLRQREKHQFGTAVASSLAAMSGLRTVPRWHGLLIEKHLDRRELSNPRMRPL